LSRASARHAIATSGGQFIPFDIPHDGAPADTKQLGGFSQREPKVRAPLREVCSRHGKLLFSDPAKRRSRKVKPAPFGLDRPSYTETIIHDLNLRERFGIMHERLEVLAAGRLIQSGQGRSRR